MNRYGTVPLPLPEYGRSSARLVARRRLGERRGLREHARALNPPVNSAARRLCGMPRIVAALRGHILLLASRHFRRLQVLGTASAAKACLCDIVFGRTLRFTFWWIRFHWSHPLYSPLYAINERLLKKG